MRLSGEGAGGNEEKEKEDEVNEETLLLVGGL